MVDQTALLMIRPNRLEWLEFPAVFGRPKPAGRFLSKVYGKMLFYSKVYGKCSFLGVPPTFQLLQCIFTCFRTLERPLPPKKQHRLNRLDWWRWSIVKHLEVNRVFQSRSKSYNFEKEWDFEKIEDAILLALKREEEWHSLFFHIDVPNKATPPFEKTTLA